MTMTGSVKMKLTAMLDERGLSIEAFVDDPEVMTNREARELMEFLKTNVKPNDSATESESGDVA
jgi:hypothetical protein